MRAWQVHGAGEPGEVMRVVERRLSDPGPGQVKIEVSAAGIGLPDVLMCRGTYPLTPLVPFTPGQELAGTVTAVGPNVDVAVGTRVMGISDFMNGNGSFAAEALASAATVLPVPNSMDDATAAGFWIPNMTAWMGLVERGDLRVGQRLVVLGAAGGTGIAAVLLGKALGATVFAVVGDGSRAEFCRAHGADHVLVGRDDTVADGRPLAQALRELTDWQGIDMVFDPVGGAQGTSAMSALAREGRHLAIGFASGTWPTVDVQMMTLNNTSLVGVLAAGYSQDHVEGIMQDLTDLWASGALREGTIDTVSFDAVPDALTRIGARKTLGKCVVDVQC